MTTTPSTTPDLAAVKARQQTAWGTGDYSVIGTTLQIVGESLAEACDLRTDEHVLDVAAGNGNATLAAARRGCHVTSTDYVPELLERGAERARAERLEAKFQVADAEALPFEPSQFDAVVSTFGVMFTPDHTRAASEMLRVTRPGGRIGLANWTPESFIGQMFQTIGRHVPPPVGVQSPMRWGVTAHLADLFGAKDGDLQVAPRTFTFRYRSPEHFLDVFRTWYGPMNRAFASLPPEGAKALEQDLLALFERSNRGGAKSLVVPSDYVEVIVTKR